MSTHSMESLLAFFGELGLSSADTVSHEACPTCEAHTVELGKIEKICKLSEKVQAKNLFFKVPSKGGALKDRMFLVSASTGTEVDIKKLSVRLGVKASAPLRLAGEDLFDQVLQIPRGSVNPFVVANGSAKDVFLLLDSDFVGKSALLFHPMRNDRTTVISSDDLERFLRHVAPGRFLFVDFSSDEAISLEGAGAAAAADKPAAAEPVKKAEPSKKPEGEKKEQTKFADDHLFTIKPKEETLFAAAFQKRAMAA